MVIFSRYGGVSFGIESVCSYGIDKGCQHVSDHTTAHKQFYFETMIEGVFSLYK